MNDSGQLLFSTAPNWDEDTPLPQWAFSRRVAFLIRQRGDENCGSNRVPPLTCTCGPGVKRGFLALASVWSFFLVAPVIAFLHSSCADGKEKGFATCDGFVLIGLLVILILVGGFLQNEIMGYVIASQLAETKHFKVLGFCFNKCPYLVFLLVMTAFMSFGYLDLMTNAQTLGKTVRTAFCPSYVEIDRLWATTMKESIFQFINGFAGPNFVSISIVAYLFMLGQPIFALMYSVPLERGVDYDAGFGKKPDGSPYKFEYETLYAPRTNHGAVLQVLAVATRMEAVNFQDLEYAKRRMQFWEQGQTKGWEIRYLNLVEVELVKGIARFFLVGLFQNAVQTNLQISLMALSKEATGIQDNQLLFSVCISVAACLSDFPDIYDMIKVAWEARRLIFQQLTTFNDENEETYKYHLKEKIRKIQFLLGRFVFYMFLYACMVIYALVKLWGFFNCPHYLINVTGCVVPPTNTANTTNAPALIWT